MEIELYSERGETSRFIAAEITREGDLLVMTQDVGKAPKEAFGDSDYEFWVQVPARHKSNVLEALGGKSRSWLARIGSGGDRALLEAIKRAYGGNARATDDFRDFLDENGIPNTGGSYA
jgi:hypothetical protein